MEALREHLQNVSKVKKVLKLIKYQMDESERKGVGGLKSHSAMLKGELLTLNVANNIGYSSNPDIPKKITLKCYSNITFWEFKGLIGK